MTGGPNRWLALLSCSQRQVQLRHRSSVREGEGVVGAVWIVTIFAICCHMILATLATLALVELLKLLATLWLA